MNLKAKLATVSSQTSTFILKKLGRGGTNLPGRIAKKIDPEILSELAKNIKIILVTGTNGKTTTTKMIAQILEDEGIKYFTNKSGANIQTGIIATFAENLGINNKKHYTHALIECDEATFRQISRLIKVDLVVVTNIFRDQLDRFGEIDYIKNVIQTAIANQPKATLCLNADSSYVTELVDAKTPNQIIWYGTSDALITPNILLEKVTKTTLDSSEFKVKNLSGEITKIKLNIPGDYNIYNALGAFAAAEALEIDTNKSITSLANTSASFGRAEKVLLKDTILRFFLVKNPAGCAEVLNLIEAHPQKSQLVFALNDRIADGTDISWIWDVDFETFYQLIGKNFEHVYITGIRAADAALRFEYAGFDMKKVKIVPDYSKLLDTLQKSKTEAFVLHTYTAMFEIRRALAEKTTVKEFYE